MGIYQYTGIKQYTWELSNMHGNQAIHMEIKQHKWELKINIGIKK